MKTRILLLAALFSFLSIQITLAHGEQGLERSTRINVNAGFGNNAESNATITQDGMVNSSFKGNGVHGALGIGKHIDSGLWGDFSFETRGMEGEAMVFNTNQVATHAVALMPIMVGLRYYLFQDIDTGFQPFFHVAAGPVIGAESSNEVGTNISHKAHTETTMGWKYGGGVDFMLTNWLAIEMAGNYLGVQDFKTPLNGATNFNGWSVSFGVCLFFGAQ